MSVHPLAFMLPVTLTCSLAFVLPVSTPPNAMAFASGRLAVKDMVGLGLLMNLIGIGVILVSIHTWGALVFDLNVEELPSYWLLEDATTEPADSE